MSASSVDKIDSVHKEIASILKKLYELFTRYEKQIRRVIDLAKPAYTMYELVWPNRPTKRKTKSTDSSLGTST